jgi:DNA modification methylase
MIINGNNIEELKKFDDNYFDSIVTDPPYEIGFMGKGWDASGIANNPEMWSECLRVLKPGGYLLSFSATRTYHRMAVAIEDSGFEIRDMIEWVYGSGFPKSLNIGKAVDKLDAKDLRRIRDLSFTEWMRSTGITATQINDATNSKMGSHYLTDKQQPAVATLDMFEKIKHLLPEPPDEIMQLMTERTVESENFKKREVVEIKKVQRNSASWETSKGMLAVGEQNFDITKGTSEFEGKGTALKPAHEPICMARKPLAEKTVAENCLKYGTGGINIDESRVETDIKNDPNYRANPTKSNGLNSCFGVGDVNYGRGCKEIGRFPANLIHDNSEEVRECFPETHARGNKTKKSFGGGEYNVDFGQGSGYEECGKPYDSGNASRFFKSIIYQAKASKSERGVGNIHPTVKPVALMEYLIKMVTPTNGIVLDPFMGSGSTGVACVLNDFEFVGIDLDKDYCEIARARIEGVKETQTKMF